MVNNSTYSYVHFQQIGHTGDSSLVDRAIDRVTSDKKKVHHSVFLHLQELGIKMECADTGNLVLNYTYPEVGDGTADCRRH